MGSNDQARVGSRVAWAAFACLLAATPVAAQKKGSQATPKYDFSWKVKKGDSFDLSWTYDFKLEESRYALDDEARSGEPEARVTEHEQRRVEGVLKGELGILRQFPIKLRRVRWTCKTTAYTLELDYDPSAGEAPEVKTTIEDEGAREEAEKRAAKMAADVQLGYSIEPQAGSFWRSAPGAKKGSRSGGGDGALFGGAFLCSAPRGVPNSGGAPPPDGFQWSRAWWSYSSRREVPRAGGGVNREPMAFQVHREAGDPRFWVSGWLRVREEGQVQSETSARLGFAFNTPGYVSSSRLTATHRLSRGKKSSGRDEWKGPVVRESQFEQRFTLKPRKD